MTLHQLSRKVRSLHYRQKLLEDLPALENVILEEVKTQNIKVISGFRIEIKEGGIRLMRIPRQALYQLSILDKIEKDNK